MNCSPARNKPTSGFHPLLQFRVLRLGLLQDGDVGVGVTSGTRRLVNSGVYRRFYRPICWAQADSDSLVSVTRYTLGSFPQDALRTPVTLSPVRQC